MRFSCVSRACLGKRSVVLWDVCAPTGATLGAQKQLLSIRKAVFSYGMRVDSLEWWGRGRRGVAAIVIEDLLYYIYIYENAFILFECFPCVCPEPVLVN